MKPHPNTRREIPGVERGPWAGGLGDACHWLLGEQEKKMCVKDMAYLVPFSPPTLKHLCHHNLNNYHATVYSKNCDEGSPIGEYLKKSNLTLYSYPTMMVWTRLTTVKVVNTHVFWGKENSFLPQVFRLIVNVMWVTQIRTRVFHNEEPNITWKLNINFFWVFLPPASLTNLQRWDSKVSWWFFACGFLDQHCDQGLHF